MLTALLICSVLGFVVVVGIREIVKASAQHDAAVQRVSERLSGARTTLERLRYVNVYSGPPFGHENHPYRGGSLSRGCENASATEEELATIKAVRRHTPSVTVDLHRGPNLERLLVITATDGRVILTNEFIFRPSCPECGVQAVAMENTHAMYRCPSCLHQFVGADHIFGGNRYYPPPPKQVEVVIKDQRNA